MLVTIKTREKIKENVGSLPEEQSYSGRHFIGQTTQTKGRVIEHARIMYMSMRGWWFDLRWIEEVVFESDDFKKHAQETFTSLGKVVFK